MVGNADQKSDIVIQEDQLFFTKVRLLVGFVTDIRKSHVSAVGIVTGYGLHSFEFRCGQEFSLLHIVQTGSEVHPASYPVDTGGGGEGSFPGGKAAGA
jgi:hypothetical protein